MLKIEVIRALQLEEIKDLGEATRIRGGGRERRCSEIIDCEAVRLLGAWDLGATKEKIRDLGFGEQRGRKRRKLNTRFFFTGLPLLFGGTKTLLELFALPKMCGSRIMYPSEG